MYHANQRQGTVAQKSRSDVEGSTRKLYRQKGTGRARMGAIRTPIRRGGGRAFPRKPRDFSQAMPKKMRRLARDQAVLAKIKDAEALIVEDVSFEKPQTRRFAAMLGRLGADRGCVFATAGIDRTLYLSGRNIPRTRVMDVAELNAWEILRHKHLIFTRSAFAAYREVVRGTRAMQEA